MNATLLANAVSASFSVSVAAAAIAQPPVVVGDLGAELDTLLAGCADWGFSGSVLAALDDGVILENGYGLADRTNGTPNGPDTRFEIASMAKHVTALAVLQLDEAGMLSTGDSIARWLPDVPDEHRGVTVRHLLDHTSGFPRMGPSGAGPDAGAALRTYMSGGRVREPGAGFEYWNGGYALLAMIIERVSGERLEDYCREHIFGPAGMSETAFCGQAGERLAHGYDGDRDLGPATAHSFGWEYRGMGGIVTTVGDLWRLDHALRGRTVLPAPERLAAPTASGYTCGAWVEPSARGTPQIMLAGNVAGFNSVMWRLPEERATVVVLCNNPSNAFVVGLHVVRRLFGQPGLLGDPPTPIEIDPASYAAMLGTYRAEDGRLDLRSSGDGSVVVEVAGQPAIQMIMTGDPAVPPHLQTQIDEAGRLLQGVIDGDYERFRAVMAADIPADWPDRFQRHWASHVAGLGDVESFELLGSVPTAMSPSSRRLLFRLHHARGISTSAMLFDGGRLQVFDTTESGPAISYRFLPTSSRTLATYEMGPGVTPTIEIDDETLVIRSAGGAMMRFDGVADGTGR